MLTKIKTFYQNNRPESLAILSIILLAGILRLWRISEYMTFLGDEGRDARVVYRLLTEFDIILVGPMTSVLTDAGHMFLGPAYYYLMAPAMALAGLSPVGPAVMIAILSLCTIGLIWWTTRTWFTPKTALVAALLYAISPTIITYSHSSWNPNVMPFFAMLAMYSIYQVWQHHQYKWLIVTGICVAMILQSHYLGLILLGPIGVFWLASFLKIKSFQLFKANTYKFHITPPLIKNSLYALSMVALSFVPLIAFDARHSWINARAMYAFFTVRQTTVNLKVYKGFEQVPAILEQLTSTLLTADNILYARITLLFMILTCILYLLRKRFFTPALTLILAWVGFGLIGLSIYKQTIYAHYYGFLFPVLPILAAFTLQQLWSPSGSWNLCPNCTQIRRVFAGLLLFALVFVNLSKTPIRYSPSMQYPRTQEIAQKIITESEGKPFNLALLAKSNYDESYRFILEKADANLVAIDPQRPETITDQLFVICENPDKPDSPEDEKCNVIGHSQSEIALFGWGKIKEQWQFPWGHKLYKIVHLPPEELPEENSDISSN